MLLLSTTYAYSTLAQLSDFVFALPNVKGNRYLLSMLSNRSQATIVDILVTGLAMKGLVLGHDMGK